MKFGTNAVSSNFGFEIELYEKQAEQILLTEGKTINNPEETQTTDKKMALLSKILTISILIPMLVTASTKGIPLVLWGLLTLMPLLTLIEAITISIFFKERWRWHGAEHKLVYLYENGIKRTKENLNLAPVAIKDCGTRAVVSVLLFLPPLLAVYALGFIVGDIFILYLLAILAIAFILSFIKAAKSDFQHKIILTISTWIQQHFTTKEPKDWQIEQTLELAKELDAKLLELGYDI